MKHSRVVARIGILVAASLAAACGGSAGEPGDAGFDAASDGIAPDSALPDSGSADGAPSDAGLPLGAPIAAPANKWTWVDFADSTCDDGSPTGIGIYPSATSDKLIVYLNGGGACWDYTTCMQTNTSVHGPWGATQFAGVNGAGSILDHGYAQNPFKDWSSVFIPYCTGDVHAGNADTTYTGPNGTKTFHHRGHANVLAYLARLGATFKSPSQIAITGSSAGGGGTVFNYASFRSYWPSASMFLVDDSLPLFQGDAVSPALRTAWFQSWNLGALSDPICGLGCRADLSLFVKAIATKYPNDRMGLLSSMQDQTIRSYYGLTGPVFQTDLVALTTNVLDPLPNFRHFYIPGQSHTMLGSPATYTAAGTPLWTWLSKMASGDPGWVSAGP